MAVLRSKDIKKMNEEERKKKLAELEFELIKKRVSRNPSKVKAKEIKKAIARLKTIHTQ